MEAPGFSRGINDRLEEPHLAAAGRSVAEGETTKRTRINAPPLRGRTFTRRRNALASTMSAMSKLAPFLWFNDNAEEAAEFYLSVFPHARKLDELRSKGVGPWPVGKIATITIELEGQEMVFLNGGPAHQLTPGFSFFVRCDSQEEIDSYWGKLIEGGKPMACGWLTDRFGLCWQIVPRNIGELISHPKAMEAMMSMVKMDLPALEAAARES